MQVDLVCHGTANVANDEDGSDPYEEPKRQGKFEVVPSGNDLTFQFDCIHGNSSSMDVGSTKPI